MPSLSPSTRAVISAVFAALLAVVTYRSHVFSDVVVVALMLVFAWGWPVLVALPAVTGRRILLTAVALGSAAAVYLTENLTLLAGLAALAVLGGFVLELARRDGRPRTVESLAASAAGTLVLVSGAGWLAMPHTALGIAVVLTTAGALSAGAACAAIHLPPWPHSILTIVGATVVGAVAAITLPEVSFVGVAIGFAAGLLSASLHQLLNRYGGARKFTAALAAAALPVVVVGIPVYALVRFYLV